MMKSPAVYKTVNGTDEANVTLLNKYQNTGIRWCSLSFKRYKLKMQRIKLYETNFLYIKEFPFQFSSLRYKTFFPLQKSTIGFIEILSPKLSPIVTFIWA